MLSIWQTVENRYSHLAKDHIHIILSRKMHGYTRLDNYTVLSDTRVCDIWCDMLHFYCNLLYLLVGVRMGALIHFDNLDTLLRFLYTDTAAKLFLDGHLYLFDPLKTLCHNFTLTNIQRK